MNRLKILHITPNGHIGGRERQVNLLLMELAKCENAMENDILFINPEGPFFEQACEMPIRVFSNHFKTYDPRFFQYMLTALKKYDIVNFWGIDLRLFFLSLLNDNIKIYTLTGTRFSTKRSLFDRFQSIVNFYARSGRRQIPDTNQPYSGSAGWMKALRRFIRKKLFIYFLKKCSLIITPSNFLKVFAVDQYKVSEKNIRVIPNFLDFSSIGFTKGKSAIREELGVGPEVYMIGVVARFDARKRLDRIVKTMELIPKHIKTTAIIFGDGDKDVRNKLENEILQKDMHDRVLLPGFRKDIYNYINALDMFVLPSEGEGFGIALLEALYLKIPSVVFADGGGVLEIIRNEDTGFVVHTEEELSELVQRQIVDRNGVKEITDRGYRNAVQNYGVLNAGLYSESFIHAKNLYH